jgi:hypothetical protein
VDKDDDTRTGDNKLFRLAATFSPGRSRLRQVPESTCSSVVGSAAGERFGFRPFNLRVQRLYRGTNMTAIE